MKKYKKIILILLLIITIISALNITTFAKKDINPDDYNPGKINKKDASLALDKVGKILGVIRNIGVITSVLMLSIIGLKYMLGSLDEKANYKETMFPYFIGCILLMGASIIPSAIYSIFY